MNNRLHIVLLLSALLILGCEKKEDETDKGVLKSYNDKLTGNWVNPEMIDTLRKFEKSGSLNESGYGFSFKADDLFIERKNSGWCGTPPISYADYQGTWTTADSIISITVPYWGGTTNYRWKIIEIDDETLMVDVLDEVYTAEE
jgi:hypothetical protein